MRESPIPSEHPLAPPVEGKRSPDDVASQHVRAGYAASRLSGLRNLLIALGRRSLNEEGDKGESDADIEPRIERAAVHPSYPPTQSAVADTSRNGAFAHQPAQPEFLPPKPFFEAEKEKEVVLRPAPPRRDKPDPDEIQTLPSWRGQYAKKRYPPM